MNKRYKFKADKPIKISIFAILCAIYFLTLGFSSFANELSIDAASALVVAQKNVKVQSISLSSSTSSATSFWEENTDESISSSISLPNSDSTITYEVTITNIGNIEAAVSSITGLPSNLTYTLNNYELNTILCDDQDSTKCKLGTSTTISITIGYAQNGYNSGSTDYILDVDFHFLYKTDAIALLDNTFYDTLQGAVEDVPDSTKKTITLLNNTSELITTGAAQDIVIDLGNRTITDYEGLNVFINNGTLELKNGTISTTADQGAINNEPDAELKVLNLRIIATGRQTIYNKGTVTIEGNTHLESASTTRAALHNYSGGTMYLKSGEVISTGASALINESALTLGEKDGTSIKTNPLVIGVGYGIDNSKSGSTINFYDGIVKGITKGIAQESNTRIVDFETGYDYVTSTEMIGTDEYKTSYTAITYTVTFNPNNGTIDNSKRTKKVERGGKVGELPVAARNGYLFLGWYDTNDVEINENTIINSDITFKAEWEKIGEIAQIGIHTYDSLQQAINTAPADTQTTIKLLKDTSETLTVASTKNIIIDLDGHTLSNNANNKAVIETSGILSITNGTITTNASTGAINVNAGTVYISSGNITATGARQAVYILGGTVEISGTAQLTSKTDGAYNGVDRGTVTNVSGTLIITGGTIENTKSHAVSNASDMTIGAKDGTIDTTTPIIIGKTNGVKSTGTFNFYDGKIRGGSVNGAINGTITDQEEDSRIVTVNGSNYEEKYLELIE